MPINPLAEETTDRSPDGHSTEDSPVFPALAAGLRLHLTPTHSYIEAVAKKRKQGISWTLSKALLAVVDREAAAILALCDGKMEVREMQAALEQSGQRLSLLEIRTFLKRAEERRHIRVSSRRRRRLSIPKPLGSFSHYTPLHASIELTSVCNFKCCYCYASCESTPAEEELSAVQWIHTLDGCHAAGVSICEITGGEPLLSPAFPQVFDFCTSRFSLTAVLTNGSLLERIEKPRRVPRNVFFLVSLDAADKDLHMKMTGAGPEAFGSVCNGIQRLTSAGVRIVVAMTLTTENVHALTATAGLARTLGAEHFAAAPAMRRGRGWDAMSRWTHEHERVFMDSLREVAEARPGYVSNILDPKTAEHGCQVGRRSVVISPKGVVRGCVAFPAEWWLGRLPDQSLSEIVDSDRFRALTNLTSGSRNPGCSECAYESACEHCVLQPETIWRIEGRRCWWSAEATRAGRGVREGIDPEGAAPGGVFKERPCGPIPGMCPGAVSGQ